MQGIMRINNMASHQSISQPGDTPSPGVSQAAGISKKRSVCMKILSWEYIIEKQNI